MRTSRWRERTILNPAHREALARNGATGMSPVSTVPG